MNGALLKAALCTIIALVVGGLATVCWWCVDEDVSAWSPAAMVWIAAWLLIPDPRKRRRVHPRP